MLHGVLNLSVLDGWWAEAYDGRNGFAIGRGETHTQIHQHDHQDAESFYSVLQDEVIPLYYDRDKDGLPRAWIARMKRAIRSLGWRFSADRMVMDYVHEVLRPRRRRAVERHESHLVRSEAASQTKRTTGRGRVFV